MKLEPLNLQPSDRRNIPQKEWLVWAGERLSPSSRPPIVDPASFPCLEERDIDENYSDFEIMG